MALVHVGSGPVLSGTMSNDPWKSKLPRVIVGVDESGDRNSRPNRQSDYFTMSAVLVEQEHEDDLRLVVNGLKTLWNVQGQLHWVRHLRKKHEPRRALLVSNLARVPGVRVIHVILDKPALTPGVKMAEDGQVQYNWLAGLLHERIALAAHNWQGGERVAQVHYGLVGGVNEDYTCRYLNHVACRDARTPWGNVIWQPKWMPTASRDILQVADMYSGVIGAAVRDEDDRWLQMTSHQFHRSPSGLTVGWGLKIWPPASCLMAKPWVSNVRIVETP